MKRTEQAPVEKAGDRRGTKEFSHPAFGQIRASRVHGEKVLYGSDYAHQHFITIEIVRSQLMRDLSRDWHFGREELIEISLSEAQWATFVSSLNIGSGVPCTLEYVGGESMPLIPLRNVEDVSKQEVQEAVTNLTAFIEKSMKEIDAEIGKSLSGVKKNKVMQHLEALHREVKLNLPFMAKSFGEHMEERVEKAKTEVHAYIQNAIVRAGVEAIPKDSGPLQLNPGEVTDESRD